MAADHPEDAGLDAPTTSLPQHKLRWFQFSLRTLLVVMTLICVFLGMVFNYVVLPAERQRAAVQAIAKFQLSPKYRTDPLASPLTLTNPFSSPLAVYASAPKDEFWLIDKLRSILPRDYFYAVLAVDLTGCEFQDLDLVVLKQLPRLRSLGLSDTNVTDAGLENLKDLVDLEELELGRRKRENLSDIGIAHLKNLKKLKSLWIYNSTITDAGMLQLSGMTELIELHLPHSNISDSGLMHLRGLSKLKFLNVANTLVTRKGVLALQEAIPSLSVDPFTLRENVTAQNPPRVPGELMKPTKDQRWRLRIVGKRGGRHFQAR